MKETSSSEGNNTLLSSCTYLVCISLCTYLAYLSLKNIFQEELYLWKNKEDKDCYHYTRKDEIYQTNLVEDITR
jgi:hypothetical protein